MNIQEDTQWLFQSSCQRKMNRIILASKSPRRNELMSEITNSFLTYNPSIDESLSLIKIDPIEVSKDIAKRKALKAKEVYPDDIIIAADTIVVLGNQILGKPKDEDDARRILNLLSNKTHMVVTAYAIVHNDNVLVKHVETKVTFNELSDELIDRYIKSGSPMDKAGAYGIQDNEKFPIISSYFGSYTNVVGFPIDEIKEDLKTRI